MLTRQVAGLLIHYAVMPVQLRQLVTLVVNAF